jgi:phage terminase large subunit-like protein
VNHPGTCAFCSTPVLFAKQLRDGRLLCRACEVCLFFERHLTLTADYSGKPFLLMPWTREVLRDIFGTLEADGSRQYRDVYLEVPKKNTKTTLCAGMVVLCLATAPTTGTEVYSAATSKEQAAIVFRAAAQMVKASQMLSAKLDVVPSGKRIVRRDDLSSFYCAISADGDIHDGMQPSFVVRDELHRWRTRKALELNEILERGMIARREPLCIDITTAGESDESPLCWRRHEYASQILEGSIQDRRFYGRIWAADPKRALDEKSDYWKSREARVAANPSHEDNGGYLKDSVLEDLCVKAQNDPAAKHDYLRYHLNIWGEKDNRAIDMPTWIGCGMATGRGVDLREWPVYDAELLVRKWTLQDRPCWAGVDASWTTDLTSVCLVFPPHADDELFSALWFYWMPAEQVAKRQRVDKVPYREWIRKGFMESVPGSMHDYTGVQERIKWAAELFDLQGVAYDPANFRPTAGEIERTGVNVVEVTQRYPQLNPPTKLVLGMYQDGRLRHGNNPIANWNAGCLALKQNNAEEVMPDKPVRYKSSKRIDGMSALVTAMALVRIDTPQRSIYEDPETCFV